MSNLLPDPSLYAGGVSAMVKGSFLNPHLDNSHDASQKRYRVLNSLYYVTPDWREEYGGNLELWDEGPKGTPRTIHSRFNRLVVMETNRQSWHSASRVTAGGRRTCVSNYFFREQPLEGSEYFHATSFRGRPEQRGRDLLLRADTAMRTALLFSVVNVPTNTSKSVTLMTTDRLAMGLHYAYHALSPRPEHRVPALFAQIDRAYGMSVAKKQWLGVSHDAEQRPHPQWHDLQAAPRDGAEDPGNPSRGGRRHRRVRHVEGRLGSEPLPVAKITGRRLKSPIPSRACPAPGRRIARAISTRPAITPAPWPR